MATWRVSEMMCQAPRHDRKLESFLKQASRRLVFEHVKFDMLKDPKLKYTLRFLYDTHSVTV